MADDWYGRNEKTIKWATLIGSWAAGIACIATGVGTGAGLAIIGAGSLYATKDGITNTVQRLTKKGNGDK